MARRRSGEPSRLTTPLPQGAHAWPEPEHAPRPPLEGSPVARLRPRTAPQILDAGFEVLAFRGRTIAILLAVFHGPFFAASLWMLRHGGGGSVLTMLVDRFWPGDAALEPLSRAEWWACGALATALFGEMLFAVALATLMRSWLDGDDPLPAPVVRAVARRVPAIALTWLFATALKLLGAALCIIGLIAVVPQLSILGPVVAFERGNPFTWLNRSRNLANRSSQRALYLTAMAPVLSVLVLGGLRLGDGLGINRFDEFATVMGVAATLALVVARCSATTLFYLDIRVRTEGLDLALRAPHALGVPA